MLREFLEKYETRMLKKGKFTRKMQPEEWKKIDRLLILLSLVLTAFAISVI